MSFGKCRICLGVELILRKGFEKITIGQETKTGVEKSLY